MLRARSQFACGYYEHERFGELGCSVQATYAVIHHRQCAMDALAPLSGGLARFGRRVYVWKMTVRGSPSLLPPGKSNHFQESSPTISHFVFCIVLNRNRQGLYPEGEVTLWARTQRTWHAVFVLIIYKTCHMSQRPRGAAIALSGEPFLRAFRRPASADHH